MSQNVFGRRIWWDQQIPQRHEDEENLLEMALWNGPRLFNFSTIKSGNISGFKSMLLVLKKKTRTGYSKLVHSADNRF